MTNLTAAVICERRPRSGLAADVVDTVVMGQVIQPRAEPPLAEDRLCCPGPDGESGAWLGGAGGLQRRAGDRGGYRGRHGEHAPGERWRNRMGDMLMLDSTLRGSLNDTFSGRHSSRTAEKTSSISRAVRSPDATPSAQTGVVPTHALLHSMRRDGLKRGIVTLCIGGGQGIARAIELLGQEGWR
ncbi:hypothetical protein [Nocardia rhamnosiphila]|uniref:Thiolase C-terminal domain-containing protein n=1 Tax=Nocardia rhamnosiphila TaxID=426716 RepID=A0ABV2WRE9_9NOCA